MTLEPVAEGPAVETNDVIRLSDSGTTSPATSPSASVRKTSKTLTSSKSLEEFIAVEEALTKSPYIVPMDVASAQRQKTAEIMQSEGPMENCPEHISGVILEEMPKEEPRLGGTEVEKGSLLAIVEEYAKTEERDVSQSDVSPESSPFVEFPEQREERIETDEPPSPSPFRPDQEPSQPLIETVVPEPTAGDPVDEPVPELTNADTDKVSPSVELRHAFVETAPEATQEEITTIEVTKEQASGAKSAAQPISTNTSPSEAVLPAPEATIKRMPSIQRRGQEYLSQYLQQRRSQPHTRRPSIQIIEPVKPPTISIKKAGLTWATLALWIVVFWSLAANVILMVKLSQAESGSFSTSLNMTKERLGLQERALWWGFGNSDGVAEVPVIQHRVHGQSGKIEFATVETRSRVSQATEKEDEGAYDRLGPWMRGLMERILGRILW